MSVQWLVVLLVVSAAALAAVRWRRGIQKAFSSAWGVVLIALVLVLLAFAYASAAWLMWRWQGPSLWPDGPMAVVSPPGYLGFTVALTVLAAVVFTVVLFLRVRKKGWKVASLLFGAIEFLFLAYLMALVAWGYWWGWTRAVPALWPDGPAWLTRPVYWPFALCVTLIAIYDGWQRRRDRKGQAVAE